MRKKQPLTDVNLVAEAHKVVTEISNVRTLFAQGKLGTDAAKTHVGLFNATSRAITTAVAAEKWKRQQLPKGDKK